MPVVPTNLLYDFAAEAAAPAQAYIAGEVPKAVLVASARSYAAAHHMAGGTVMALVSAAIMGAYRALRGPMSAPNLRSKSAPRSRPMDRAPKRLSLPREPGSVSSTSTSRKNTRRAENVATGLETVERPLRLQKTLIGDKPKSVWSSLRDMVTGKKVLKNTFSFKMASNRDKRGLMAIPLRHDGNLSMDPPLPTDWTVGSQTAAAVPSADGFGAYSTMLKEPLQIDYTGRPQLGNANVIAPRMNLPTLEQTSWDLNNLKLIPTDDLMGRLDNLDPLIKQEMVSSVLQLGGSAVPYNTAVPYPNSLPNGYPSAATSYARCQTVTVPTGDPTKETLYQMPRFKTQLGGGSLNMRMCNQGTNSCTVEFVVVKVSNPYVANFNPSNPLDANQITTAGVRANMSKLWANLYDTVGWEHSKKVQSNLSYAMGTTAVTLDDLQLEPINNPYKPWLPDSCFKSRYDQTNQYVAVNQPYNAGGLYAVDKDEENAQNPLQPIPWTDTPNTAIPFGKTGGAGQKTPYRVVNRGHCTISGAAERNVTIPIPGSNYDASKIQSVAATVFAGSPPGTNLDDAAPLLMSDESYAVLISVNGSLQDIIEPQIDATTQESTGNVKVIGKAYTSSIVDFYCQYTETVYPSHCDYSEMSPVAYNLGQVRTAQLESSTNAYPGKIMPMADAVPVTQAGVLRTGAKDRAGDNAGST